MYFTIKILRFFVRLCIKVVLLPITLGRLLLGVAGSSDDDYGFDPGGSAEGEDDGTPVDPALADDSRGGGTKERRTTATDSGGGGSVASAKARTNIERFRKSFYVVGALHFVLAVGIVFVGFDDPYTDTGSVAGIFVLLGLAPVAIGAALSRWPKPAWYAGMGYVGLQLLFSVVTMPVGLLTIAIYGAIGYFGWTGRPALVELFDIGEGRSTETRTAPGRSTPNSAGAAASKERRDRERATASASPRSSAADDDDASSVDPSETSPAVTAAPGPGTDTEAESGATESQTSPATAEAESETAVEAPAAPVAGGGGEGTGADDPAAHDEASAEERSEQPNASDATTGDPIARYRSGLIDADPTVRKAAVEDVTDAARAGDVPDEAAVDALVERLESDANADVRAAACTALGELGTGRARGLLADYRLDPDSDVSRAASRALRTID